MISECMDLTVCDAAKSSSCRVRHKTQLAGFPFLRLSAAACGLVTWLRAHLRTRLSHMSVVARLFVFVVLVGSFVFHEVYLVAKPPKGFCSVGKRRINQQ